MGSRGGQKIQPVQPGKETHLRRAKEGEGSIPSHKMVAPTRRRAHLGARHTPLRGPGWPPGAGRASPAPARAGATAGASAEGWRRRPPGRGARAGARGACLRLRLRPPAGGRRPTHLGRARGARERRRSRGNEWSRRLLTGEPQPVREAPLAASRADAAVSPWLPTPVSWSAGRPQPTEPSAGVTHSRRSASSPCSGAAPRPPRIPPPARAVRPSLAPGTPPCLPPGLAAGQVRAPPTRAAPRPPPRPSRPRVRPGSRH